jgi:hypothetical protein
MVILGMGSSIDAGKEWSFVMKLLNKPGYLAATLGKTLPPPRQEGFELPRKLSTTIPP